MEETGMIRSYLDSTMTEGQWQGWYITRDKDMVVRLDRCPMESIVPGRKLVDYRAYYIDTGRMDGSGIACLDAEDTIRELHSHINRLCEFSGVSFKMCDLGKGIFCDSLEEAYLRKNGKELGRACEMIHRHF